MKRWMLMMALVAPLALSAREVRVGTAVCNPGARVRVPVALDDASGAAGAAVALAFAPLALTLESVRPGALAEAIGKRFHAAKGAGRAVFAALGAADAEAGAGTLATLTFLVREGSAGLYSDVTPTEARLSERTLTRDLAADAPLGARGGQVRIFATDGACETRQGEGALTVAAGTTLRRVALEAGDALEANAAQTPIVITEALEADGELRILPPEGGWATARYAIVRCPNASLALAPDPADAPDAYTLTQTTEGGLTTYALEVTMAAEAPIETETELSPADENLLRDLLGDLPEGVRTIRVEGTREAILAGLDLGIAPATSAADGTLTARFEKPTLRIVAFDPKAGTARVRVIPAEGATVARPLATGVLQVRAAEALGAAMAPLEAEVDASGWLGAATKGEATLTFRLGRNLFIKVVAERPATQTDTEKE